MNRTIKDAAEILGVSKTSIRKYLTPEFRDQYTELDSSGKIIISQNGFEILMDAMGKTANKPDTTANQFPETTENQPQTTANQFPETTENQPQTTENQQQITENSEHLDRIAQNRLYEILEKELQAKNEQIAALQAELSAERQHSREQAEKIAVLADQAQQLQLAQMAPLQLNQSGDSCDSRAPEEREKRSFWRRIFG